VIAGNEGALRFYRREGASDYLHTFIMPVGQPLFPRAQKLTIWAAPGVTRRSGVHDMSQIAWLDLDGFVSLDLVAGR
jgi:hypothetical protein